MSMVLKQTSCSHFACQGSYYATHTHWTKHHNEVMSWISGVYECHYAWPLPEANVTTVRDWRYRLWAACPCLSRFAVAPSLAWSWFTAHELVLNIAIWNPFAQFKFSVYGQTQTYIHTRFALQSTSVGLSQARPKYCFFKFVTWLCAEAITEPAILWCYKCFLNCGILNEQSIAEYLYETESCGGSRWML